MAMLGNQKPIQRNKLNEEVFERLCAMLRQGEFPPGEALAVARIADAFGVSAMPVREALTRLMALGALTTVSGRSVGVPKITLEQLQDLRDVRLEIEALAVRWAVARRDDAFVADLRAILVDLKRAEATGDFPLFVRANYDFHARLYRQAGSPTLDDVVNNLWLRVSPHLYHIERVERYRVSNEQHEAMIEAVVRGDAATAAAALVADISGAYDDLASLLRSAVA